MNDFLSIAGIIFCSALATGWLIYFYVVIVPDIYLNSGKVIAVIMATAAFSLLAAGAFVTLIP